MQIRAADIDRMAKEGKTVANEQSESIQVEGCSVIYDMGSGLVIAKVQIDKVKEQDINARVMKCRISGQPIS